MNRHDLSTPHDRVDVLLVVSQSDRYQSLVEALDDEGFSVLVTSDLDSLGSAAERARGALAIVELGDGDAPRRTVAEALRVQWGCRVLAIVDQEAAWRTIEPMRSLVADFVSAPLHDDELVLRVHRLLVRPQDARGQLSPWLESSNPRMRALLESLRQIARTEATVLLRGETGTGKEVLARAVHAWSPRHARAFFCVSCGALTESLLESELFGHERGAFTGAVRRKRGLLELAGGGTLFLDEIGELSLTMQVKLLRVLQEHEFIRVGGEEVLHCDVRVVAATHRDLESMIRRGELREDFYYRIQVFPVFVPPLRERGEDLTRLAETLLHRLAATHRSPHRPLSPAAQADLVLHEWPGNVRELENVLARSLLLAQGDSIERLALHPSPGMPTGVMVASVASEREDTLTRALQDHHGNVAAAAVALGISRRTFYRRMRARALDPAAFRGHAH